MCDSIFEKCIFSDFLFEEVSIYEIVVHSILLSDSYRLARRHTDALFYGILTEWLHESPESVLADPCRS